MHPHFVGVFDALHKKVETKILNPFQASRGPTRATSPIQGVDQAQTQLDLCPPDMADLWAFLIGPGPTVTSDASETFDHFYSQHLL